MTFFFGFLSYMCGEASSTSGIIATFTAGIFMGLYTHRNLSREGQELVHAFIGTVSNIMDMLIFFSIGSAAFVDVTATAWSLAFVAFALCLLGRAVNIFPLTWMANRFRLVKISWNHQVLRPASVRCAPGARCVP